MQQRPTVRAARRRKRLALLLPGHNEELIIETTIRSALKAGQRLLDIYVVDDASSDKTREEALKVLPASNVLTVERSGKALAVQKAIKHFDLEERYTWLHVADADSVFGSDYFYIYRSALHAKKYAAAVGFVQSMRGNWISCYRALNYTYGQHIFRRIQGWFNMISVLPGPVTCFRTDIIKDLDFQTESLTEDFDLTLQIHRQRLGRIKFIPDAINFTQDPRTLSDFCKQTARWQRGFFQGLRRHRIGRRAQRIDVSIGYQLFETLLYLLQLFVLIPYFLFINPNPDHLRILLLGDAAVLGILALLSAVAARRLSILFALPYYYPMRLLELSIFLKAFVEVVILRRFMNAAKGWKTEGRRYKLDENALKDIQ
jgi:cellulose synthase/poly-beta-1,6-N-acetylglucosamine synthase-like glycosyltransferase